MKFDRSNKFDLCYYGQVNSLRLNRVIRSSDYRIPFLLVTLDYPLPCNHLNPFNLPEITQMTFENFCASNEAASEIEMNRYRHYIAGQLVTYIKGMTSRTEV